MTLISALESRARDHQRNAKVFREFASLAEEDGKIFMARLYRRAAACHDEAADRLEGHIKELRSGSPVPTAQQAINLLRSAT